MLSWTLLIFLDKDIIYNFFYKQNTIFPKNKAQYIFNQMLQT